MNRIIALICTFALCISLLPTVGTRVQAYSAHTADEAICWLNSLLDQKVGTGQCVALIKAYYSYLGVSAVSGHAYTYATDTAKVPSGWSRIEGATPQKGDVMIWTGGPEGYGHVAICGGDSVYFHQNFSGQYVEIRESSYIPYLNYKSGDKAPYWGVIRPDFSTSSQAVSVPEPSDRAIVSGNYMIKNAGSTDYFMNVYAGKDANGTKVVTWTIDTATDDQHFWFSHQGNGAYFVYAVGLTNRVLDLYYGSDSAIGIGDYLQVWTKGADDNSSLFNVVPVGNNKFVFELKYMNNAVLTMTSASNNAAITLQQYTGSDAQHWYICDYSGNVISTCDLLGHSYAGTTELPTCMEQGCTTYVCTTCGNSYTADYVAAVGHSYESVITEPTEDAQGYTTHTCTVCGDSYIDSYTDPIPSNIPEGLEYEISNGEVTITGYTGSAAELIIPDTIEGYPVTAIGDIAFKECESLTSIAMPDDLISIGSSAFSYCNNLSAITFPSKVTSVGMNAFSYCYGLTEVHIADIAAWCEIDFKDDTANPVYYATKLFLNDELVTELEIPEGVTEIGSYCFVNCISLTAVSIPEGVTRIGPGAFENCNSLLSVTIPDGVSMILHYAFRGCTGLTEVTIPDSVTYIGVYTFASCKSLTDITIPSSVTEIGAYAFSYCTSLDEITIPASTTAIGIRAFERCSNLTGIWASEENPAYSSDYRGVLFNKDKTELIQAPGAISGEYAIPEGVCVLCAYAFDGCKGLTWLSVPEEVCEIGAYCFMQCSGLSEIYFEGTPPVFYGQAVFGEVSAIAWYPFAMWSEDDLQDYGGSIQWTAYGNPEEELPPTGDTGELPDLDDGTGSEPEKTLGVVQWNLVLEDALCVNFYLNLSDTDSVQITLGESSATYNVLDLEQTEGYYKVSVHLAAAQMTDTITVQVDDLEPEEFTVRQYCETILSDASQNKYHQLVKEMLNYGAMAQLYFDHNTENLANEGITGVATVKIPESADAEITVTGHADGVSFFGASLVFKDKIAMRYYYATEENIFRYAFGTVLGPLSGIGYEPVYKDNMYYVQTMGILPQDLDEQIEVYTTNCDNGTILNVSYSPMNYIVHMNQKGSESMKALVKALYNYHLAAKALRTETI